MKILHTSDWHLGRTLFNKRRYDEFEAFLNWLADLLESRKIDVLLVAGDVFDTSTPSTRAIELYFNFLAKVAKSHCKHVVVTAGNHDSPTLLSAPQAVLKPLNIHVVASCSEPLNEVLHFRDIRDCNVSETTSNANSENDNANNDENRNEKQVGNELIVCAVPFLHDRDMRRSAPGEKQEEKQRKLLNGIQEHYRIVCEHAKLLREQRNESNSETHIPIIVMGHLFAAGASAEENEGVRELYIGSLAQIGADTFPEYVDYVALGHLHSAQKIGGAENMRYCGSPIPMGFGEATQEKFLMLVEFDTAANAKNGSSAKHGSFRDRITIEQISVPCFQRLERVRGDWNRIFTEVSRLKLESEPFWIEVEYIGDELLPNLKTQVEELLKESEIEVLRLVNRRVMLEFRELCSGVNNEIQPEVLSEISPAEMFQRCMDFKQVPDSQREELEIAFREISEMTT